MLVILSVIPHHNELAERLLSLDVMGSCQRSGVVKCILTIVHDIDHPLWPMESGPWTCLGFKIPDGVESC